MLQPADRAVLHRDPGLPGLRLAFDPTALTAVLCEALPEAGVRSVVVDYLRYKPNTNCVGRLWVESSHGVLGGYLKAFHPADHGKLATARERTQRTGRGPFGPGRLLLEAWASTIVFLPHDNQLKAPERLTEPMQLSRLLSRLGLPDAFSNARLELLSYRPERRYVAKVTAPDGQHALLKLMRHAQYERARRCARAAGALAIATPRLLGTAGRHGALALSWLEGRPLAELMALPAFDPTSVDEAGVTLARLHASEVRFPRRIACDDVPGLSDLVADLAAVQPHIAPLAHELARRLSERLDDRISAERPIHGDCHPGQILLTDAGVALLDFDRAALGPPLADVGQFIAQLEWETLRGALDSRRAVALRAGLLTGYTEHQPVAARVLDAHIAHALVRLAPHPFRMRAAEWPRQTRLLLTRAMAWLDGVGEYRDADATEAVA